MSETKIPLTVPFTPALDSLVQAHGGNAALVFGRVWRYCQMADGVCWASQQRIANDLHLSRRTVIRCLRVLVQAGYLEDLTPTARWETHSYRDTGKAFARQAEGENEIPQGVIDDHPGVIQDYTGVINDHT